MEPGGRPSSRVWGGRDRNWSGMAVFALACSVGVGWGVTTILLALPVTQNLAAGAVDLLTAIGGGMVGVIGCYVGVRAGQRHPYDGAGAEAEPDPEATLPPTPEAFKEGQW